MRYLGHALARSNASRYAAALGIALALSAGVAVSCLLPYLNR